MGFPQPPDHRLPTKDLSASSVETPVSTDDYEMSWTPAVQKLYDEFLADERMYVSEGLWDRFPAGSRLFIGEHEVTLKFVVFYLTIQQGIYPRNKSRNVISFIHFIDTGG